MKRLCFLSLLMLCFVGPLHAQGPSDAQIDAERDRIGVQRRALDARHAQERTACYKRFAVEDCLRESRRRMREETEDLRRQETALNDIQRKRRGEEQLKRLDERQAAPHGPSPQQQQESREAQRSREERAAERESSRAAKEAEAAGNRAAFESRQRDRAESEASAARRRAEAPEMRNRYDEKVDAARRRREALEKRNAERSKPPAAPLPVPGEAK